MIEHLAQGSCHPCPPRLFPIDGVHGLVQEESDPPSTSAVGPVRSDETRREVSFVLDEVRVELVVVVVVFFVF